MDSGAIGTIVGLLGACLVALVLVLVARREASLQRSRAEADVASIKDAARAMREDVERRERRLTEREQSAASERNEIDALERRTRADAEAAAESRRASQRILEESERAAAARAAAAERDALAELETVTGLTADDARAELTRRIVEQAENDAAAQVRRADAQARRTADARARRIVTTAVQRLAVPTSTQSPLTVLPLPSDEMKGRIIGKEGRNIRSFEALTGVNVLVDDQPDAVVLSCFDTERREVAQVALEALMADGRIHPQRIEQAYAEALDGADERTDSAGHEAAERAGVRGLHPTLVRTLGRLRLRTSYGQNVLEHLVESAQLAAALAAEIGADVEVTRRGAFLHDLGKALTAELPGTHAALGADLARRHGESATVVNAIAAHHDEVPPETVEAVLVQVADAISASRPGARREELGQYVERIDKLEQLVGAHAGVQAGAGHVGGPRGPRHRGAVRGGRPRTPAAGRGDRPPHRGRPRLPG